MARGHPPSLPLPPGTVQGTLTYNTARPQMLVTPCMLFSGPQFPHLYGELDKLISKTLSSLEWSVCMHACVLSHVQLFLTPWTVACQAPLSLGFPRQEYWSGLPFPPPGELPGESMYLKVRFLKPLLFPELGGRGGGYQTLSLR